MKSIRVHAYLFVTVLALLSLLFLAAPNLVAQQNGPPSNGAANNNFNPPPCDYSDLFYQDNGVVPTQISGRFGTARQFGPPARNANQANWVADSTCAGKDPIRRNFRILATTGGYIDDGSGSATDFISLIGFLQSQSAFESSYLRTVGLINGGLDGVQQNPGEDISMGQSLSIAGQTVVENPGQTLRGFALQDIVSNFEAYPALKQTIPAGQQFAGQLAPTPCGSNFDPNIPANSPCFSVASEATPNLREDWRFASNRNAMDGSDNNDPIGAVTGSVVNAPFGYFCDDLVGIWINTYFWFTHWGVGNPLTGEKPQAVCNTFMQDLKNMHGTDLDGTGIITTADELNFLEGSDVSPGTPFGPANGSQGPMFADGQGCAQEGKLDTSGVADFPGAVWDICPTIQDPRAGAIASDAFLDSVRFPNGLPLDIRFNLNFASLQLFGVYFNELISGSSQQQTATTAANSN